MYQFLGDYSKNQINENYMFVMKKEYLKIWLKLHLSWEQTMQLDKNNLHYKININK